MKQYQYSLLKVEEPKEKPVVRVVLKIVYPGPDFRWLRYYVTKLDYLPNPRPDECYWVSELVSEHLPIYFDEDEIDAIKVLYGEKPSETF